LNQVLNEICSAEATEQAWGEIKEEFQKSGDGYITSATTNRPAWAPAMQATMTKFVAGMDFQETQPAIQLRAMLHVNDPIRAEDLKRQAVIADNLQEVIENYMLLVNASLLVQPDAVEYAFMDGLQFPGLWSRELYDDPTRTKKYRNMLVGSRPFQFQADSTGWRSMLLCARMVINKILVSKPNGLLSEYDTNLAYALNHLENKAAGPPAGINPNPLSNVDKFLKEINGGTRFDMMAKTFILPTFLGTPCGVTSSNGFIFIITTDGEIFQLQMNRKVDALFSEDGGTTQETLLVDLTRCIVAKPNRCIIRRLNFQKNTTAFPALTCHMPSNVYTRPTINGTTYVNWHTRQQPTCLLAHPRGEAKLYVLSCAQCAIYEINWQTHIIKKHIGGPLAPGEVRLRGYKDPDEDEKTVKFQRLTCGVFDADANLFVVDNGWMRRIKYDATNRTKFTVKNMIHICQEVTSIALGPAGFVVGLVIWNANKKDHHGEGVYDQQLCDIVQHTVDGKVQLNLVTIKDFGHYHYIGSMLVDGANHNILSTQTNLRCFGAI
jgi:hypothetical protein